jgi:hypothetical protein
MKIIQILINIPPVNSEVWYNILKVLCDVGVLLVIIKM